MVGNRERTQAQPALSDDPLEVGHAGVLVVIDEDEVERLAAPAYRDHMRAHEGRDWRTVEHTTHVDYQTLMKDLVLESEYLGASTAN